ncbi:MAG: hypothetical protein MUO31_13305 [Thermodesulfovibrionales bacterium]|nr:hypothetical protein [Thermodesulfovibrionales bacterium]
MNDYEGTVVSIDFYDGDLHAVLSLLSDAARIDGYVMVVDRQIKGKIQIKMYEPWNLILVEILAGVNFVTTVVKNSLIISYNNSSSGSQVN